MVHFSTVLLGEVMREHEVPKGAPVQGEEGARDSGPRAREMPIVKEWVRT